VSQLLQAEPKKLMLIYEVFAYFSWKFKQQKAFRSEEFVGELLSLFCCQWKKMANVYFFAYRFYL